jgi:hypothetical protein
MANRKKSEADKASEVILIRVTPGFKEEVEEMAQATRVPTSERARVCLTETLRRWKAGELDKAD